MRTLFTYGNPKTDKSADFGYLTAVLHLAPADAAGHGTVCALAELAGCIAACLNTAGRGGVARGNARFISAGGRELPDNTVQRARIERTRLYATDRDGFMAQLAREIETLIKRAERAGLRPCVRLNGTSDIAWERKHPVTWRGKRFDSIMAAFPAVAFMDYTKRPDRFRRALPANYALVMSDSGANPLYLALVDKAQREHYARRVRVVRTEEQKRAAIERGFGDGRPVVDGDAHDLVFLQPAGAWIILRAKARAKRDTSGFVFDYA